MSKQVKLFDFLKRKNVDIEVGCASTSSTVSDKGGSKDAKCRKAANRKYSNDYIKYGFSFIEDTGVQLPQCVICAEVLSNDAMKPAKLIRHFESKHKELMEKPVEFFKQKELDLKKNKKIIKTFSTQEKSVLKASFLISLRIVQAKKPFTIGEALVLPCIIDATNEILGASYAQKMKNIPLSNNTVSRRIEAMASDVESQLIAKIHISKYFALQLDESTDVTNKAILLVYVRYIDKEINSISEEYMTCIELPGHTTGEDIFKSIDGYLKLRGLAWKDCVGLCTDGAAAMTGYKTGLSSFVKKEAGADIAITHCIIHREMLAAKRISPELNEVLSSVVKAVNFIKRNALNSRLFALLCEDMGSLHSNVLFHTEVRWLSRGRVLSRFWELREEICMFLDDKKPDLAEIFRDCQWVAQLAFLADIFELLNVLNLGLQGPSKTSFDLWKKIDSFKKKLELWESEASKESYGMFSLFSEFIFVTEGLNKPHLKSIVVNYIKSVKDYFEKYFPADADVRVQNMWVADPFIPVTHSNLSILEKEELIEISTDTHLRLVKSQCKNLSEFWVPLIDEYPQLSLKAMKLVIPFHSTYLCETSFSTLSLIKNKQRNRLINLDAPMRMALTALTPNIEKLCSEMQDQGNH